ncbi:MAG: group I intron-associated PD-(D/E)XK endonuclease [Acidobacteriota bacterium]|nr:group I intron-associated PD-(D/E)XK endonuclease [Acidobacteriota bacterium]
MTIRTYDRGNISEALVMAAYLKAGLMVSVPFGTGAPYDLIVDTGSRLYKIQIKTGWLRKGCINYKSRRRIREAHPYATRPYAETEMDYFAIYYPPTTSIYAVPFRVCHSDGCLRLDPVQNGQQKLIRWAQDFSWEKHIQKLMASPCEEFCQD